jgi:DNA-binding response OmpR family regulator
MKTVLLVDDDQQLRKMLVLVLRNDGYKVLEADSGTTGFQMARRHLPDLIISDLDMPGGNGVSLLRDIRLDPELKSRQVVLMTGRADLLAPREGMESGADDFLLKPIGIRMFLNCVKARFNRVALSWQTGGQVAA